MSNYAMHEASLVKTLLTQLDALVAQHGGGRVQEICVEVGLLAGVEPLLFYEAYNRERIGTLAEDADLVIDSVGLTCQCTSCQLDYVTEKLEFICPTCATSNIKILGGDTVTLHSFALAPSPKEVTFL